MSHKSNITNDKLQQLVDKLNYAYGYTNRYRLVAIPGVNRGLILEKAAGSRFEPVTTRYTRREMAAYLIGAIDSVDALRRRLDRGDARYITRFTDACTT